MIFLFFVFNFQADEGAAPLEEVSNLFFKITI